MNTYNIIFISGDENAVPEMPTGYVQAESIEAIAHKADGEIVGDTVVCEWGNGEDQNVYRWTLES
jgi:hypothetical protein